MPVTTSAKKALRVATRRHAENIIQKDTYKQAIKGVRKAVASASSETAQLLSNAQRALDTAAKKHTIHPNKAARLKSRLAKKLATATPQVEAPAPKKRTKKATPSSAA